jgi:predicted nucleic acid-binding protein
MSAADSFFDTNVLLYLLSKDAAKADLAEALLATCGVVSVQVLNEFASVATRKMAMTIPEIREILSTIRAICVVRSLDIETHDLGLEMAERYGFSIYDGLIVAAAVRAGSAASSGWWRIIRSPAAYLFTHYILPIQVEAEPSTTVPGRTNRRREPKV